MGSDGTPINFSEASYEFNTQNDNTPAIYSEKIKHKAIHSSNKLSHSQSSGKRQEEHKH